MDDDNERVVLAHQALRTYCTKLCERGDFRFGELERRRLIERLLECSLAESRANTTGAIAGSYAGTLPTKKRKTDHG